MALNTLIEGQPDLETSGQVREISPRHGTSLDIPNLGSHNLDDLLERMKSAESSGKSDVRGKKGELGLFQIMPSTAKMYGVSSEGLLHPEINRAVAKRYLTDLVEHYHGDVSKAVAAYNAGPHNVDRGIIPSSTKSYLNKILGMLGPNDAGAAEAPKGTDPSDPANYSSYDEYKAAWKNSPAFAKATQGARTASFNRLQMRWDMHMADKAQAEGVHPGAVRGLDFFGKLNEASGRAADIATQSLMDHIDPNKGNVDPKVLPLMGLPGDIARAVVPESNIQAGIDAALWAMGGPEIKSLSKIIDFAPEAMQPAAKLGARLGITGLGGAAGGATEGKTSEGFKQGVKEQAAGEVTSLGLGVGRRAIQNLDVRNIGKYLNDKLGTKIGDVTQLKTQLVNGEAERTAQTEMGNVDKRVIQRLAKQPMGLAKSGAKKQVYLPIQLDQATVTNPAFIKVMGQLPKGTLQLDYKEATNALDTLEKIGWNSRYRMVQSHGAAAARSAAHQVEEDIANGLTTISPNIGKQWYEARGKLRTARTMSNLFRETGIINGKEVDIPKLQKLVSDAGPRGYNTPLRQSLGDKEAEDFTSIVHRGASPGTEDVHGKGPVEKMYMHLGIIPSGRMQMPRLARHVGYVPYNLGKTRATTALVALGPHELANKLAHMFGSDDTPQ